MSRSESFWNPSRLAGRLRAEAIPSRRDVLKASAACALGTPIATLAGSGHSPAPRIAIVGGGLAGLVCADVLESKGFFARIYEASDRFGGRCHSNRSLVPGMACENGGEFLDTGHKTMLRYANEFNLEIETVTRKTGEEQYFFFGRHWSEEDVVNQFREVVARMQTDLHRISGAASFFSKNDADIELDNTDLASYFSARCSGYPLIEAVLNEAYLAEYGLETSEQSTLNFLGFMRLNKQSKFEPFGVSDERYHLRSGNDGIVAGLVAKTRSSKLTGARLTRLERSASGEFELYFNGSSKPDRADAVVLTVPFAVLRHVELGASLGLSSDKVRAIRTLGYGTNAKTMVAFDRRFWADTGAGGGAYADLPHLQNCWESNRANARQGAIVTDYASGSRGASLRLDRLQVQVREFLGDYDRVLPGALANARRDAGRFVAHLEAWPQNPLAMGSYTCYRPGQFTGIEGLAGQPSGLLKFAGEHSDSFYSWQGYMEGACLSGSRAAKEVLADIKAKRL